MGQRRDALRHSEAWTVHLGVAGPLGRRIVEEEDPLGQHHPSGAPPGNGRLRRQRLDDAEESHPVVEDPDVPAGDEERAGLRHLPGHSPCAERATA